MSYENIIAILSVVISAIVAVAGYIIVRQTERLRAMREQLSEKKYNAYADAVKMFYTVLKDVHKHKPTNNEVMKSKMIDMKRDILMYGSDKVFQAFNTWLLLSNKESNNGNNNKEQLVAVLDFIHEMRKDMCNNNTKLTMHDILLNITQSED